MKLFLFILQWIYCCARYSTRIVNTPIINSPLFNKRGFCFQHHIVLLKQGEFVGGEIEDNVYIIDFSSKEDITNIKTIVKLFLGKPCLGKLRILYYPKINMDDIIGEFYRKTNEPYEGCINTRTVQNNYYSINILDEILYDAIFEWDTHFQLYNHNCQSFSKYFTEVVRQINFLEDNI